MVHVAFFFCYRSIHYLSLSSPSSHFSPACCLNLFLFLPCFVSRLLVYVLSSTYIRKSPKRFFFLFKYPTPSLSILKLKKWFYCEYKSPAQPNRHSLKDKVLPFFLWPKHHHNNPQLQLSKARRKWDQQEHNNSFYILLFPASLTSQFSVPFHCSLLNVRRNRENQIWPWKMQPKWAAKRKKWQEEGIAWKNLLGEELERLCQCSFFLCPREAVRLRLYLTGTVAGIKPRNREWVVQMLLAPRR